MSDYADRTDVFTHNYVLNVPKLIAAEHDVRREPQLVVAGARRGEAEALRLNRGKFMQGEDEQEKEQ